MSEPIRTYTIMQIFLSARNKKYREKRVTLCVWAVLGLDDVSFFYMKT